MKVVLVAAACLLVVGIIMIAGLFYIGHRVKQAVVAKAKSYGVELPVTSSPAHAGPVRIPKAACDALSQADASRLLGEPIAREQSEGDSCTYFGPPGLYAKLAEEKMKKAIEQAKKGGDPRNPDLPTAVDQTAPVVFPGAGGANGSEAPLLILVIGNDGKAQMTAMLATAGIFGGFYKAAGDGGHSPIAEVPNLGDRAVRLPKLGLNVLKGDVIIRVVAGPVEDADAKTVTIAKEILNKL